MAIEQPRVVRVGVQPIVVSATPSFARQTYRVVPLLDGVEGEASQDVACSNDLSADGNMNFVHWHAETPVVRVYRSTGGLFEQIAEIEGGSYQDAGE